jgi:integrase
MQAKITITSVAALAPGDVIRDTVLLGFEARRRTRDVVYCVRGRLKQVRVRMTIGRDGPLTPQMARKEAQRLLGLLAGGQDPREKKMKPTVFAVAAQSFLEHVRAKRAAGTARCYEVHLRDHLTPRFGKKVPTAITTRELANLHLSLGAQRPLANRVLATMSSFYGWAQQQSLVPDHFNPVRRVERYKEYGKERFLTVEELRQLGKALREVERETEWGPFPFAAFRLLLLTGCRRDEVRTMRWTDIDWHHEVLNLRGAKGGPRTVHLNEAALAVLRRLQTLPGAGENPYVIRGRKTGEPFKNLQKPWDIVRLRAGLGDVRLHDLRHSVASLAGSQGASLLLIGAVLGHRNPTTTKKYVHVAGDPAKALAAQVGSAVALALGDDAPTLS